MIIFYHELDSTSNGGAILIMNLIRGLVKKGNKVVLINFKNGAIHQELLDLDESLLLVINNDKQSILRFAEDVSPDDIIITTHFYSVFRFFKKRNPKILFYCVGHIQLFEVNKIFGKLNFLSLTSRLINLLREEGGILFIEQNALKQSSKMLSLDPQGFKILPIPIVTHRKNLYSRNRISSDKRKEIVFTYVGRAVDSKIFPVKKIISDLIGINLQGRNLILHIVTDNPTDFQALLPTFRSDSLRVEFHENLSQQKLDDFLLTTSDIHFAQATSALEGSKLGIPTILVDFAFSDFPEGYRYSFVHQTDAGYIGTDVNEKKSFAGITMGELLELVNSDEKMKDLSQACYEYTCQNHEVSIITSKLEQYIADCRSSLNLVKKYLIRYWFR